MLATEYRVHESELRADLQEHYGVNLDRAMAGEHSAWHISCLVEQLPLSARIRIASDADCAWGLQEVLTASLVNSLNGLIWGMGDKRTRGARPALIGPERLTRERMKSLPARAMSVDELMEKLSKPRG